MSNVSKTTLKQKISRGKVCILLLCFLLELSQHESPHELQISVFIKTLQGLRSRAREDKHRDGGGPIAPFAASGEKFDQRFSGRPRLSATFCSSQQGLTSAVPGCHVIVWLHLVQSICSSRLLTVRRQRADLRGPADT